MKNRELIEKLMQLPMDMPVGAKNYYGEFGEVTTVQIEKDEDGSDCTNTDVIVIDSAIDLQ